MDAKGPCKTYRDCHGQFRILCRYGQLLSIAGKQRVSNIRLQPSLRQKHRSTGPDFRIFDQRDFASRHGPTYHEQDGNPSSQVVWTLLRYGRRQSVDSSVFCALPRQHHGSTTFC
ncbi:hypothetical protein CY34DRAFT_610066 [Suillus luteus UH-Slu-Lm8-n1]|uniref:Uncharacterized protein n=1 Tax=Suillus luteus UH-Slu-Lm8-n1 TaxID=930992 RepID=A0A0D0ASC6_9AGAM|nr:hypothetical protein CY34DRAFT_610066 [Suillus luteus UH-Slu-Lm8-n1]